MSPTGSTYDQTWVFEGINGDQASGSAEGATVTRTVH